jgi:tetratricopeptide (TPR) repeat protein
MLFPINIHPTLPDDPSLISRSLFEPGVLISILIISALLVTAIKIRKKFGLFSFGVLWFFITLIPVSNIPLLLTNYMAARYLYIPGIGFYLLLATCIVQLPNIKFPSVSPIFLRKVSRTTIVILLAFYSLFTVIRNMVWKNNVVFRLEMVEKYPNNALAHSSLGDAFRRRGLLDKAIYEYKIALRLDPNYAEDHDALGVCYYKKGMLNEAIEKFKRAIQLDRLFVTAYANLGSALGDKGFYQESMVCFEKAIEIDSNFINAYDGLGITYARMKKYDEARKVWERAREIGPYNKKLQEDLEKLKSLGY